MADRRVAVTGPGGRLGRAVLGRLAAHAGTRTLTWGRPDFDLDDLGAGARLVELDRPNVVVHTAAWTDVDGCSREPSLATLRNGAAVGALAAACATRGVDFVLVSTNEVFDGRRTDGQGYAPGDAPAPINAYGASKLEGETRALAAFEASSAGGRLAIVRTSWLFGPPGSDFPTKIIAASEAAALHGKPLRVVDDEYASPTSAADLALAIAALVDAGVPAGIHHCVNEGTTSRFDWARVILRAAGRSIEVEPVPAATWTRASTPPAWGVLAPTPLPGGLRLPAWQAATEAYVASVAAAR
jgi:dTDP-4-dehydrorhamnose reductase